MSRARASPGQWQADTKMNWRSVFAAALLVMQGLLSMSEAFAQASNKVDASPPASADSVNPATVPSGGGSYRPRYLPSEVKLSQAQVDEISKKVTEQYLRYHESLVEQNKSAALNQQLWAQRALVSLEDDKWHLEHARGVYKSQSLYSLAIFVTVMLIVIVSLVLTIHQFLRDSSLLEQLANSVHRRIVSKRPNGSVALTTEELAVINKLADAVRSNTNADIGTTGVKIGTQLVGLAMLAFSMGFFYLYLTHVYPITVAPPVPPEVVSIDGATK